MTTTPANDTASSLPVGCTVESSTWRAHRYAGHVVNANQRGSSAVTNVWITDEGGTIRQAQ